MFKNKKAFDLPFSWIFSIIAGSIIIFLALYVTVSLINTSTHIKYSQSAQELLNQLNPVVNGITSAYATKISFKKETRIELTCNDRTSSSPFFGRQTLSFAEESGFIKKWQKQGESVYRYNKYIFSDNLSQGKDLFVFSKPFFTSFRVDDLIILSFNKYCFVNSPSIIQEEIDIMTKDRFNSTNNVNNCPLGYTSVCFGFDINACNISVIGTCSEDNCESQDYGEYKTGYVSKNGKKMYYYDSSLLYAAIFSSPEIYECNIKRLGKKSSELASIYRDKIDIVKLKNCNTVVAPDLDLLGSSLRTINSSLELLEIYSLVSSMNRIVCKEDCKIYYPQGC